MNTAAIEAAAPGAVLHDRGEKGSINGLHLRVFEGRKSFYLYYRTKDGRQRRPKIGDLGTIGLTDARKIAKAMLADVASGKDPVAERAKARAEMTVDELWAEAWKGQWSKPRYTTSGWGPEAKRLYTTYVKPRFGKKRLSEVTPAAVREWLEGYEANPYSGNRALAVFKRMFSFAEERELRPQHTNPCMLVKPWPERKRRRYATPEELQRIGGILEREAGNHPAPVAFLYILMFSGARPRSIERATWDQLERLDGGVGVLTFAGKSSAKTGDDETVVLPPQAMRVIDRLPRVEGRTITGIKMPRKFWNEVRVDAGCPDLWARDMRRTFATVGLGGGLNMDAIGELLNHRAAQTTKVYARLARESGVAAAVSIAGLMEGLLTQPPAADGT